VEIQALRRRAEEIAEDRDRGAAELLALTLPLLADALAGGRAAPLEVARVICRGQPAMAPLWNACAAAVADASQPGRFARRRAEMERAPAALVRAAGAALRDALSSDESPHLLTLSYSSSLVRVLGALAADRRFRVTCGESRPRYEGRRMATDLAAHGIDVTLVTDAALASALASASAVVVGADAFAPVSWTNKVGTRALAAAASLAGVPTFVICARDKARPPAPGAAEHNDGPPAEIWEDPPPGIRVANPYFETIPAELATLFLMEIGRVGPDELDRVCTRYAADLSNLVSALGE
jgi:translation initiation factor 2B subunit (eIF-2B alpha/beta/delta family)